MDPVSALGLLASLSSLIKASNSLLDAVKGIKDAEKDFLELYNDLAIFDEALKGFDRVLRSRQTRHNLSRDVVYSAVEEASKTIQDLDSRLLQIAKTDVSAVRRLKCAQHKSSLKKSHDRLKEQSTMLQSFLALAHTETFLAVCSEHPHFLQLYSDVTDGDGNDNLSTQGSSASETTTLFSGSSKSSLRRKSVDTAFSSIDSLSPSFQRHPFPSPLGLSESAVVDAEESAEQNKGERIKRQASAGLPNTSVKSPLIRITNAESNSEQ